MKQKPSSPHFADVFLGHRKVRQTFFSQIDKIIGWNSIRSIIEVGYTKGRQSTDRLCHDSMVLLKAGLLRTWYGLGDGKVEDRQEEEG